MEFVGLFFEIIFLVFGVYLYLFSVGKIGIKDSDKKAKAESFRKDNATWMRIGSLALIAIMVVNIFLHVSQILGKS